MKFAKQVLIVGLIIAITIGTIYCDEKDKDKEEKKPKSDFDLVYNQKEVYPNQYEAATNTTALDKSNFSSPPLSSSLFEQDPTRKLRLIDFTRVLNFVAYRLTRGETEQMFLFADGNRDGLLDNSEWDHFVGLYILPFEACDRDHDYLLDENEFGYCFQKDPKFKSMIFPRRYGTSPHTKIMGVMSNRQANLLNFGEYLFTRRASFAWKNCQSNAKFIAKSHFACALKTALSFERKFNFKLTDDEIYMAGLRLDYDAAVQHNFVSYLRILHYFNLFNIYSAGNSIAQLEKQQLIKAIREDRLPNNLEESEVEAWYEIISSNPFKKAESMGFSTFVFFYSLHELFNKYSIKRPNQLNKEEILKLLNDEMTPGGTVFSIDKSFSNFKEAEYLEASLTVQRLRPNENAYFVSFLSLSESENTEKEAKNKSFLKNTNTNANANTASEEEKEAFGAMFTSVLQDKMVESLTTGLSKFNMQASTSEKEAEEQDASANTAAIWVPSTVNATYAETVPNKESREAFYSTFKEGTADFWTKQSYYRAFALGNLFAYLVPDERFVIPSTIFVDKLMAAYEKADPPVNIKQRENYSTYKFLSRDVSIDILTFFAIENWRHKLKAAMRSSNTNVPETMLKLVLQDLGMRNMPDTVLDLGKVGASISKHRLYNPEKTMEYCIYVQSIASDNKRMSDFTKKLGLKKNSDPSRRFPGFPRRFQASPHV